MKKIKGEKDKFINEVAKEKERLLEKRKEKPAAAKKMGEKRRRKA